jgi:hypothetical protein
VRDWREQYGEGAIGGQEQEQEMGEYDEKELEKRKEIVARFQGIGLDEDIKNITDLTENAMYIEVAFKPRVGFHNAEFSKLQECVRSINTHVAMAQSILDAYIRFPQSTPDFDNIKNVLYGFHKFIWEESSKSFHIERVNRDGIHYLPNKTFRGRNRAGEWVIVYPYTMHVNNITYLLSRLIGVLDVGGWYLIDVEGEKRGAEEQGRYGGYGGGYGGYGGGYGGFDGYPYGRGGMTGGMDSRGNINVTKIVQKRDIGDGQGE